MDRLQASDPSQIGPFRLLGRLGEGGMGRVYLATSPGGPKVAIKVVHPQHANDPAFRRRFAREVEAARQVGGVHTAAVVDADPDADPPWMATAYIPGPSLSEAIARRGPLGETEVRELGTALAGGLMAIHARGLIHRDLKPGNIILADDGPRIIDFGIAKLTDATALTGSNAVLGTLRYMSPEQLHGQELTPLSDVFALGTVLAYAATGRDAFAAPTIPAVITRILKDPPNLDPLTGDLHDILADCLAKEPGTRPSLADLLARFHPPQPPSDSAKGGTPPPVHEQNAHLAPDAIPTSVLTRVIGPQSHWEGAPAAAGGQPRHQRHRRLTVLIAASGGAAVGLAVIGILVLGNGQAGNSHTSGSPAPTQTASRPTGALTAGTPVAALTDPASHGVNAVAFGPGGILATGDGNGSAYLWNTSTGHVITTLTDPGSDGVRSVAFGPGGILATGDGNGSAYLWNTSTGHVIKTLTDPAGRIVYSVAFGPGGTLATGDDNGRTYLWNTTTGHVITTLTDPGSDGVRSVAFGPGGTLATGDDNGYAYLWNTATGHITATLFDGWGVYSVGFAPDGTVATGDNNHTTHLWNAATRHIAATLTDPAGKHPSDNVIESLAFGPGGTLATGEGAGSTYLWNTATRHITATLTDPSDKGGGSVAFGSGGILASGANGKTYLWKITGLES